MPLWAKQFDRVHALVDLSDKVIIVTRANSGIGYCTMKHLTPKGAKVYLGARSEERGRKAVERLKEGIGAGEVIWFSCNLDTPAQAKASAEGFLQIESRLDVLVNNAAIPTSKHCHWAGAEG